MRILFTFAGGVGHLELDAEREEQELRDGFARRIARERARDVLALCGTLRPDHTVLERLVRTAR